ncbi:hypothetical protein GCM10009836_44220 [Pseudonocardia ailaonensis]|uniref:Carnitine dehydratase n=1 Tax=Pseudonocardia ailaonensis TaxID=367279 RepID=A0ABN2NAV5_9PSEU
MSGVLEGLTVLDLSWGVAGPITGMMLADQGAAVTKIEPPTGDPFRDLSGYQVWGRGKRSAFLDLKEPHGAEAFRNLAASADVVLESFSPGTMQRLGLDHDRLSVLNPRLITCSITGYGQTGPHAHRPAYDALVAARTGHQWESRGVVGGTIARLAGSEPILEGIEAPEGCWRGAERDGPLFSALPWPSLAAASLATLVLSAALRAREVTGRGQWVQTSLLQGVLATTGSVWQRVERPDAPDFQSWVNDPRAPHGVFRCADDRWIQQWMSLPSFLLGAAAGEEMADASTLTGPRGATDRIGPQAAEMIVLHHYQPLMAEAVRRFDSADWSELAAKVGVPLQVVRSPEEALGDPELIADGIVVEVDDPKRGPVRQVGRVIGLSGHTPGPLVAPVDAGADTEAVLREAATRSGRDAAQAVGGAPLAHALSGIRVLDLGLAVAGPYGGQMLADLGAEVIKVNRPGEEFWMSNAWAMGANRGKRSIGLNLKEAGARTVLRKLVASADVVMHNMRMDAATRIGLDEASLREINPNLVYCHTRGHDTGPRAGLPGNDQTAGAIAGTQWAEGATDAGGQPLWPCTSLGDPGNGLLAAIGIVQALYERERTGKGQFVDTAIVNAHLLNNSQAWMTADGTESGMRPRLDRDQTGWDALYRLYRSADDAWICIAVRSQVHWEALCRTLGRAELLADPRFDGSASRAVHDEELTAALREAFAGRTAQDWFDALDGAGVPCEISTPDFVLGMFDDADLVERQVVTSYPHPAVGKLEAAGLLFELSETPGTIAGPPFVPGQHTDSVLADLDYSQSEVDGLLAEGAVFRAKGRR